MNRMKLLIVIALTALCTCSGGGADVGNPLQGIVMQTGNPVGGARVVLARADSDPGFGMQRDTFTCASYGGDDIGICGIVHPFDTTFTDKNGEFLFEDITQGAYTIHSTVNGKTALVNVRKLAGEPAEATLHLAEPAVVKIRMYEVVDTAALHFTGARIAGTGLFAAANSQGEIILHDVPEADVTVLCYRSDSVTMRFESLRVRSGGLALLAALPTIPPSSWTAHHCGPRFDFDRPFVLETCIPMMGQECGSPLDSGIAYTVRIKFSDAMDALATTGAIKVISDDPAMKIVTLQWAGSNVVYITLGADSGTILNQTSALQDMHIEIAIDTTAQTAQGVTFGYPERILFVPKE